ncbi:hypothetical protein GCM10023085_32530 [Actinomadura viridis]|uniref:DUF2207 domain-containing protein n=1 Tax=Actinomadura viridis TaxID=58110 RepID=A0A931GKZ5_9ACTN|nr:DUF2207 domain-containing protein [Actinomadura viridis]MBG6086931.1 hypothetical protein [Actinomadura viridis]
MPDVRVWFRGVLVAVGMSSLPAAAPAPVNPPVPVAAAPTPGPAPPSASAPAFASASGGPETDGPAPVESIPAYDVVLAIDRSSVLRVRETITYDFEGGGEHGIVRRVPYRRGDRLYEIRNVRTSSSTGAPARARTLRLWNDVQINVGGGGARPVTGRQAYVIEYEVAGAFTPRSGRDELVWDAIGSSWRVPIGEAAVRVEAPVPLRKVGCRAGAPASSGTRCLRDRDGPFAIDFTQRGLRPGEGVVVQVRLPEGAVAVPPPRYARPRWAGTWAGTAALAAALAGTVAVAGFGAAGRPFPRRRPGEALVTAGVLLVLADVADDVVPRGPWAFSLGDLCLAGLSLALAGAGIRYAHRTGRAERAAIVPEED